MLVNDVQEAELSGEVHPSSTASSSNTEQDKLGMHELLEAGWKAYLHVLRLCDAWHAVQCSIA